MAYLIRAVSTLLIRAVPHASCLSQYSSEMPCGNKHMLYCSEALSSKKTPHWKTRPACDLSPATETFVRFLCMSMREFFTEMLSRRAEFCPRRFTGSHTLRNGVLQYLHRLPCVCTHLGALWCCHTWCHLERIFVKDCFSENRNLRV